MIKTPIEEIITLAEQYARQTTLAGIDAAWEKVVAACEGNQALAGAAIRIGFNMVEFKQLNSPVGASESHSEE